MQSADLHSFWFGSGKERFRNFLVWLWQGAVPKLLYQHADEVRLLVAGGMPARLLPWIGLIEITIGLTGLLAWRWRGNFLLTGAFMLAATLSVVLTIPEFFRHAFNPLTLNLSVLALCAVCWIAQHFAAFAGRCRRRAPWKER